MNLKTVFATVLTLCCLTLQIQAQNWSQINFSVNSTRGNTNCHNPDKLYNFSYSISLPSDQTTPLGKESYKVIISNTNNGVVINDLYSHNSIKKNLSDNLSSKLDFGTDKSGSFFLRYLEGWNRSSIKLRAVVTVQFTRISGTDTTKIYNQIVKDANIPLANLSVPTISINGTTSNSLTINATGGCNTYTLSASANDADQYVWSLPANWQIASGNSTSPTIQVIPYWDVIGSAITKIGDITVTAKKNCDGVLQKSRTIPVNLTPPSITSNRSALCYNGSGTIVSIPNLSSGSTVTWFVDAGKVQILSGQNSNSVNLKTNNYYSGYTTVTAVIGYGSCGITQVSKSIWMGVPSYQTSALSGPSTAAPGDLLTFQGSSSQGATSYSWGTPSNGGGIINPNGSTPYWNIWSSGIAGTAPYAHIYAGETDGIVQAIYENTCGTVAAVIYVDVTDPNGGGIGSPGGGGGGGIGPCCGGGPIPMNVGPATIEGDAPLDRTDNNAEITSNTNTLYSSQAIQVYPNPSTGRVTLKIPAHLHETAEVQVKLYQVATGQLLFTKLYQDNMILDLQDLPSGNYLVEIMTEKSVFHKQIVLK